MNKFIEDGTTVKIQPPLAYTGKYVEFYSVDETLPGKLADYGGKAVCEELPQLIVEMLNLGVEGPEGQVLTLNDGLAFMEVLHMVITGTYLRASKVLNEQA